MAKSKPEGKKYSYMDTYGDLVTLLLCFFVLLFSMSTVEEVKYNAFVEALAERFGPTTIEYSFGNNPDDTNTSEEDPSGDANVADPELPKDLSQLAESLQDYIEQNQMQEALSVQTNETGSVVYLRVDSDTMFDGNSSTIRREALPMLRFIAEALKASEDLIWRVNFLGHTASLADTSGAISSAALSSARAANVCDEVKNHTGLDRMLTASTGHGRNYPIADNFTAEGRAKNRRVDIVIIANDATSLDKLLESSREYFPGDDTGFFEGSQDDLVSNLIDSIPGESRTEESQGLLDDLKGSIVGGGDGG